MEIDRFQQAWQAHSSWMRVTVNADLLHKFAQRDERSFQAMIFRQDCRVLGIALLMLPIWFYLGFTWSLPWTWYLTIPALVWVGGFILVDRIRQHLQPNWLGEPLLGSVKRSLTQVEHQIWLLRNLVWWYLLPCIVSFPVIFAQVAGLRPRSRWELVLSMLFVAVFYAVIYFVNQLTVRLQLEPRQAELLELLTSLNDGNATSESSLAKKLESARKPKEVRQPFVLATCCGAAMTCFALAGGLFDSHQIGVSTNPLPVTVSSTGLIIDLR